MRRRGINGRIREALHFPVQHRYRHRAAGHIERGDEVADQRPRASRSPLQYNLQELLNYQINAIKLRLLLRI
jgi:hypothetical protein